MNAAGGDWLKSWCSLLILGTLVSWRVFVGFSNCELLVMQFHMVVSAQEHPVIKVSCSAMFPFHNMVSFTP